MSKDKKYGVCQTCKKQMAPNIGCSVSLVQLSGKDHKRIKAGDALDFWPDMGKDDCCHDCNAGKGQYHHGGCDAERCPLCSLQLIGCSCW